MPFHDVTFNILSLLIALDSMHLKNISSALFFIIHYDIIIILLLIISCYFIIFFCISFFHALCFRIKQIIPIASKNQVDQTLWPAPISSYITILSYSCPPVSPSSRSARNSVTVPKSIDLSPRHKRRRVEIRRYEACSNNTARLPLSLTFRNSSSSHPMTMQNSREETSFVIISYFSRRFHKTGS